MCGICGIAHPSATRRSVDRATLVRMRDVLTHRGPDAAGIFLDEGVGLGHRRLSIVDVAHGHQPMGSDDGNLQLVYNGEVYNHPTLSAELQSNGVRYQTHCDTETVLRIFEREGTTTPRRLRGMFAFAIWNRRRRELFLARDRLGVKPLYYTLAADGSLFFASEIKALFEAGAVRPELNFAAFPDYLANHAPSGEETLFVGVKRLLPGTWLLWRDGRIQVESYWDLSFAPVASEPESRRDADMVAEYRERLRDAVRMRLMADVPLGSFLSGGIDSAAITALMTDLTGGGVKTFSVAFAEREANELGYARMVAKRFATDHHEVVVEPDQFFAALPSLVWHEDEPIAHPSSVALNFVSRLAAERVKVVLTGEGSDETLAGYGRYRTTVYNLALGRWWERFGGAALRRPARRVIDALPAGSFRRRLARTFVYLPTDLSTLYLDNFAVFDRNRQRQLLSAAARERIGPVDPYAVIRDYMSETDARSILDQLLYADTKTYLHELLMKQDQMSMAASIESRVPFLDHPLMEFAARLPQRMKLRGLTTKWVLREAMRGTLPDEILSRRKMGFPVPIGRWVAGKYRPLLEEYVLGQRALDRGLFDPGYLRQTVAEHQRGEGNHAERLWALVNVELWHRIFIDGEAPADASAAMVRLIGDRAGAPPAVLASPAQPSFTKSST